MDRTPLDLLVAALLPLALAACGAGDGASSATNGPSAYDAASGDGADAGAESLEAGDAHDALAATDADASTDASASCPAPALTDVLLFTLTHAAYPGSGHPDVAVHVPSGFDPCRRPSVVVFFHGFDNCVANVIGAADGECTPGGPARSALHLAEQLDAANVNAILVAAELVFDQATGAPGDLAQPGEFRAMLHELLATKLSPLLGSPLDVDSLDRVVLASHSGGYEAVAEVLQVGGVEASEVELFDSLYGYYATYEAWIDADPSRFDPAASPSRRLSDVWTTSGGTMALSEALVADVDATFSQAGLSSLVFYQDATAPTPTDADLSHPLVFKHSELSHVGVPLYYFERIVAASGIAPIH